MPAPVWEDLGDFFRADDFAVPVFFRRGDVVLWEGSALFEDENGPTALGDTALDLDAPHVLMPSAGALGIEDHDEAVVAGAVWDVMGAPEHDGTGLARVRLAKPTTSFRA